MLISPRLKIVAPPVLDRLSDAYRFNCVAAASAAEAPVLLMARAFSVTLLPITVPVLANDPLCVETVSPSIRPALVIAPPALTAVDAEFRSAPARLSTLAALTVSALTAASVPWLVRVPVVVKVRLWLAWIWLAAEWV
ncbi:hypothetical protein GO285_04344 [Ralstonia solanacearum]|nr:hypothetical protein [Ralstonia solanacearum]NKA51311.1 hypothetical protein [Ralstonia solanacearum]NKA75384.1 hypothetical protein [Ralstonia solanacearum]NKF77727.1 hypothetical protein [Ralstonia solanacearum]NKF91805.1 hypothetical protein [Ralstonia solanacearum]